MKQYCKEFDAYYDDENDQWLEGCCTDEKCIFGCYKRPDKPSEVKR